MGKNTNIDVLNRAVAAWNAQDLNGYLTLYADDAILHFLPPGLPPGVDGARLFYGGVLAAFPGTTLVMDDVIAEGDSIAARFHMNMRHEGEFQGIPPTGKDVVLIGMTILHFADGKVVERWSESDFVGLLRQLGAFPE
ncbi:MAG: ester cyclase [Caldilineaceae bacterium]|nr:ester cyclase [Caldilineaceae bacterium]